MVQVEALEPNERVNSSNPVTPTSKKTGSGLLHG